MYQGTTAEEFPKQTDISSDPSSPVSPSQRERK
jgi:hypothetical protein